LQDPCFPFAYDYFQSFRTEPIGVRTVNGELDTDHFKDAVKGGDVKAAFLTLTANQATGESASAENKRQVIAIAEKYGVALWEDVSGFWVCNPAERTPWLWELSEGASVDVCAFDCMTKTLSPQVPISAFFARGRTRDRAAVRSLGYGSAPSAMVQKALTSFIQSRAMAAHLARNLARYQARRQAVVNALSEYMPPECSWSTPKTGFCLWLSFPDHIDDTGVYEAALSAGVGVSPGIASAVPRRPVNSVRIAYSCAAVDEIAIAIRRLAQIISARLS
jgi:DNA-binding transcriptional MocR family regulator